MKKTYDRSSFLHKKRLHLTKVFLGDHIAAGAAVTAIFAITIALAAVFVRDV